MEISCFSRSFLDILDNSVSVQPHERGLRLFWLCWLAGAERGVVYALDNGVVSSVDFGVLSSINIGVLSSIDIGDVSSVDIDTGYTIK